MKESIFSNNYHITLLKDNSTVKSSLRPAKKNKQVEKTAKSCKQKCVLI